MASNGENMTPDAWRQTSNYAVYGLPLREFTSGELGMVAAAETPWTDPNQKKFFCWDIMMHDIHTWFGRYMLVL